MFENLLKIALRNMRKKWLFTAITIIGLTVGIACFFLIVVDVRDEFSYDTFHADGDRIYRVALERIYPANRIFYAIILQGFAFRTTVAFWIFLAAGAAALAVEQATISFQAVKAARTNPADALRFE